eukprot:640967-Hanusia_phi.AAC.2
MGSIPNRTRNDAAAAERQRRPGVSKRSLELTSYWASHQAVGPGSRKSGPGPGGPAARTQASTIIGPGSGGDSD